MCYYEELVLHVCISLALRGPSQDQNLGRCDTMGGCNSEKQEGAWVLKEVTGGLFLACQRRAPHARKASWKKEKEVGWWLTGHLGWNHFQTGPFSQVLSAKNAVLLGIWWETHENKMWQGLLHPYSQKEQLKMYKWYLLIADLLKACFLWIQCVQQMVEVTHHLL